jgi:predicted RNase H-like nuclease (RuvC/YqgF family)
MTTSTTGSSALNPDLDWSQLKETVLMLNLSVAQIDQSMNEGNASVDTLASSFTTLASNLSEIQNSITQMNDGNDSEQIKSEIQHSAATALDKVQSAIIAFQFYDKLTQRLDHVSQSLSSLTALIANPAALYSPPEWHALQESIRSKYTMEEERRMFDKVLSGIPIEKALEEFKAEMDNKAEEEDDIELF